MVDFKQALALMYKEGLIARRNLMCTIILITLPWILIAVASFVILGFKPTSAEPINLNTIYHYLIGSSPNKTKPHIDSIPNFGIFYASLYSQGNLLGVVETNNSLCNQIQQALSKFGINYMVFKSEAALRNYALTPDNYTILPTQQRVPRNLTAGIKIQDFDSNTYKYTIYGNQTQLNDVGDNYVNSMHASPDFDKYKAITTNGFHFFQPLADTIFLQNYTNNPDASFEYIYLPMYANIAKNDVNGAIGGYFVPAIFVISGLLLYRALSIRIFDDKMTRMRENMTLMGMKNSSYFIGTFMYFAFECLISSIGSTIIASFIMFPSTTYLILFFFIFIYFLSFYPYAVCMTALFKKRVVANSFALLGYYITFQIVYIVTQTYLSTRLTKLLCSLLPPIALANGLDVLINSSSNNIHINSKNLFLVESYGFSLGNSFEFLIADLIILFLLGLYLDSVIPNLGGISKSPLFFLSPSFWCRTQSKIKSSKEIPDHLKKEIEYLDKKEDYFEEVPEHLKELESQNKVIKIENLFKEYDNNFVAVKNLNLTMYSGQIFALLGQNGAGKTTTISMLSGLLDATSGSASMFGYDLFNDIEDVRTILGLCPQNDILFESLTVEEHLRIFGTFKGLSGNKMQEQINTLLHQLMLTDKRNALAYTLSEGHRRKLSIAIAFLGNPKIVILDEPTAGLDAACRQELWEILRTSKKDRIFILTTHYMDEADILGDRIGIMSMGRLVCCGTSLFLKTKFGIGYNFQATLKNPEKLIDLQTLIHNYFSQTEAINATSAYEYIVKIPFNESSKLESFFKSLDDSKEQFEISNYTITMTTLEDVFLKVGEDVEKTIRESLHIKNSIFDKESIEQTSFSLLEHSISNNFEKMTAIWKRKFNSLKKSLGEITIYFVHPLLFIAIYFLCITKNYNPRTHSYNIMDFPSPQKPIINLETSNNVSTVDIINDLKEEMTIFNFSSKLPNDSLSGLKVLLNETENFNQELTKKEGNLPYRYGGFNIIYANQSNFHFTTLTIFNMSSIQSSLVFTNTLANSIMKNVSKTIQKKPAKIQLSISQLFMSGNSIASATFRSQMNIYFCIIFGITFCVAPSIFCANLVREKSEELKQHQHKCGIPVFIYWLSHCLMDLLIMYIAIILCYIVMKQYKSFDIEYTWLILILIPPAMVFNAYFTVFIFSNETIAYMTHSLVNSTIGPILPIIPVLFKIANLNALYYISSIIISILPASTYILAFDIMGLVPYFDAYQQIGKKVNPLSIDVGGFPLILLTLDAVVYGFLIFVCEVIIPSFQTGSQKRIGHIRIVPHEKEQDVINEENELKTKIINKQSLTVIDLMRTYENTITAVNDLSFGLDVGEVMVLLGANGAGKSTTFKLLTNEIDKNAGQIYFQGSLIEENNTKKIEKLIGYCPQRCPLFDDMTVLDHLKYYCIAKGIPPEYRRSQMRDVVQYLKLEQHIYKEASTLSGGNKRKLAVAIALLGNPLIIMLDEPSTGIDPKARRQLWQLIRTISLDWKKSAVLMSTHSMDEAENLATKIGIIVAGSMRCVGIPQYIKQKYGKGVIIECKLQPPEIEEVNKALEQVNFQEESKLNMDQVRSTLNYFDCNQIVEYINPLGIGSHIHNSINDNGFVKADMLIRFILSQKKQLAIQDHFIKKYKNVTILNFTLDLIKLKIDNPDLTLSEAFGTMEVMKKHYSLFEYTVVPTTFEEIFGIFAKMELEERQKALSLK